MSVAPALRRFALVLVVLLLCLMAIPIVRFGMADLEPLGVAANAPISEFHSRAIRIQWLADQREVSGNEAMLHSEAERLLGDSPMYGIAYRALARVAEQQGDLPRAVELYRIAVRRAPRDDVSQAWLADYAAVRGDWPIVIAHVDALLRVSRRTPSELFDALLATASTAAGRSALIDRLGSQAPPWRSAFIGRLLRDAPLDLVEALLAPLRTAPVPLDGSERERWIERLTAEGFGLRAHYIWQDGLAAEQRREVGNVFDGSFEQVPGESGFGWRFGRVAGATLDRRYVSGVVGKAALLVEFHGQRVAFQHVRQRLALVPGSYRFSGRARPDGLRNERGLQWRLRCESGAALGETERFSGQADWRDFQTPFDVPPEGCATQWLQLFLAARIPAERWAAGRIWFDDLRIARQ